MLTKIVLRLISILKKLTKFQNLGNSFQKLLPSAFPIGLTKQSITLASTPLRNLEILREVKVIYFYFQNQYVFVYKIVMENLFFKDTEQPATIVPELLARKDW